MQASPVYFLLVTILVLVTVIAVVMVRAWSSTRSAALSGANREGLDAIARGMEQDRFEQNAKLDAISSELAQLRGKVNDIDKLLKTIG